MARGITEIDVWQAADALLLEGARPTIERVRQKIGRGSPNTVSPFLETWFRHLGTRITDPGAFSAPPTLPEAISAAAEHFWGVALAEARRDGAAEIEAAQAQAARQVEAAAAERDEARGEAQRLREALEAVSAELSVARETLETVRIQAAQAAAHLSAARGQVQDLEQRLVTSEAARARELEQAAGRLAISEERGAAAERRAALEIDRERQARAKTERRAEVLEEKLAQESVRFATELQQRRAELAALGGKLQALARERDEAVRQTGSAQERLVAVEAERDRAWATAEKAGEELRLTLAGLANAGKPAFAVRAGRRRGRAAAA